MERPGRTGRPRRLKDIIKRPLLRVLLSVGRHASGRFEREPRMPAGPCRVLVIQLGGIGDVLRVFPVLERLQASNPLARINLLTNQQEAVLDLYPGPRRPCHHLFDLDWGYVRKLRQIARLRDAGFDVVVNPARGDGMLECAVIAWLSGAPQRIGFERDGAGFLHTHRVPFVDDVSIIDQNLRLVGPLGADSSEGRLRLTVPQPARDFARQWFSSQVPTGALRVVIHPWASSHREFRAWPFGSYVALIEQLVRQRNAAVLILGSASEAAPDRALLAKLPADRVHDLAGATDLSQAAALIGESHVFLGNDSGLLHLAVAAGVPAVAVFGATPPKQVLPATGRVVPVVAGVPCQPCYRHQPLFEYRCDFGFRCLNDLAVESVLRNVLHAAGMRS